MYKITTTNELAVTPRNEYFVCIFVTPNVILHKNAGKTQKAPKPRQIPKQI
jgi:hypothetical protein